MSVKRWTGTMKLGPSYQASVDTPVCLESDYAALEADNQTLHKMHRNAIVRLDEEQALNLKLLDANSRLSEDAKQLVNDRNELRAAMRYVVEHGEFSVAIALLARLGDLERAADGRLTWRAGT